MDSEYLFLRLKKRSKLNKVNFGVENKDSPIVENILGDALHDILESDEVAELFDKLEEEPPTLYSMIENSDPPSHDTKTNELVNLDNDNPLKAYGVYEENLKELSGSDD